MTVLRTEQLTKWYGSSRGVLDLDIVVDEGEVFGFLGPNGAGKSTTIRLLLDLIRPSSGSISIFGTDLGANPDNAEILRTLLGMDRAKPFECVGTREETVAALFLTVKHFRDQGIALPSALREISETVLDSCTNPLEVSQRVMSARSDAHFVPDEFVRRLRR